MQKSVKKKQNRITPSVKLVYEALKKKKIATTNELVEELHMSPRTVRDALRKLVEMGLVRKMITLEDARKRFYQLIREVNL